MTDTKAWLDAAMDGFELPPDPSGVARTLHPESVAWQDGLLCSLRGKTLFVLVVPAMPDAPALAEWRSWFPADGVDGAMFAQGSPTDLASAGGRGWLWSARFDASLVPPRDPMVESVGGAEPPLGFDGHQDLERSARDALGESEGRAWMSRPILLLGGRTPAEAVAAEGVEGLARCLDILSRSPKRRAS